jgi:hypothetical protein
MYTIKIHIDLQPWLKISQNLMLHAQIHHFSYCNCCYHYLRCMRNSEHEVAPINSNMLKKSMYLATLGKGHKNVMVKIEGDMHNYIIPAKCWYHYQRCMTSISIRTQRAPNVTPERMTERQPRNIMSCRSSTAQDKNV